MNKTRNWVLLLLLFSQPLVCFADPDYGSVYAFFGIIIILLVSVIVLPIISYIEQNKWLTIISRSIAVIFGLCAIPFFMIDKNPGTVDRLSGVGMWILIFAIGSFLLAGAKRNKRRSGNE